MSKEVILFVFEGHKPDSALFENLKKHYLKETDSNFICAVYGTVIYPLYKEIKDDEDINLFSLLKERKNHNGHFHLDKIEEINISEIYLFFDHDGHTSNYSDEKLNKLLSFFNDETDMGKLFISYPMVESFKHQEKITPFKDLVYYISDNEKYKNHVRKEGLIELKQIQDLTAEHWSFVINQNLCKANDLVNNDFSYPTSLIEQDSIFEKQLEKYITPNDEVAVLNGFPLFLSDYYGFKKLRTKINLYKNI